MVNRDPAHPVYSNYSVSSAKGTAYDVEIRDVAGREFSCTCVDFRSNGLGTCKHVEAVLLRLSRRRGPVWRRALSGEGSRLDVVPSSDGARLCLRIPPGGAVPSAMRGLLGDSGEMVAEDVDAVLEAARRQGDVRVSQDVASWKERRERERDRIELRREYERRVQSGEWPAQETRVALFPYQREGMLHLAFNERALLADEMGLGKTIQAIAAAALIRRLGRARRALVVTPASLKAEWEEQVGKFTPLGCRVVFGGQHRRLEAYRELSRSDSAPFFVVVNYEQANADIEHLNAVLAPEIVILDEAQRIKNWSTRTAQRIKRLSSRYAFVLTGTPIENRIDDLRSIVDFLDPRILGSLFRFNREYYELDDRGRPIAYKNLDRLHARVKPILLRRRKSEVETELPARTDHQRLVPMSLAQRRMYAEHEQEVMRLATVAERRPLTSPELEKLQRELAMMRMCCDTTHILDPEQRECPKLEELKRILEDAVANNVQVIVFSEWERMLGLVRDLCRRLQVGHAWHSGSVPQEKRRGEIQRFQRDRSCTVFLTTDAGATGLKLQNASIVVNCDLPWNPARLEQRIARAWRKNQSRPVDVYHLISENTIEHRMLDTLETKRTVASSVLDLPGSVTTIAIRSGRKAMVDRVRELTRDGAAAAPRPARDPVEEIQGDIARRAGRSLIQCATAPAAGASPPVVVAIVDGDAGSLRESLKGAEGSRKPGTGAVPKPPTIEVLDRATAEAIQRLIDAGVLAVPSPAARDLFRTPAPPGPSPLSEADRAQMEVHREKARHSLRRARILAAAAFAVEALASAVEAGLELARMLAVRHRMSAPRSMAECFVGEWVGVWGRDQGWLEANHADPTVDPGSFITVLEKVMNGVG